jgi:hypothetical protein
MVEDDRIAITLKQRPSKFTQYQKQPWKDTGEHSGTEHEESRIPGQEMPKVALNSPRSASLSKERQI